MERRRLERIAPPGVRFTGCLGAEELRAYYRRCRALLFPGEEDFGIVPVEAQACGRPVVGLGRGGLRETVREKRSGLFFAAPEPRSLAAAMEECEGTRWDAAEIRRGTERFGRPRFEAEVDAWLREDGPPGFQGVPRSSAGNDGTG